jgi:hypothetical protein
MEQLSEHLHSCEELPLSQSSSKTKIGAVLHRGWVTYLAVKPVSHTLESLLQDLGRGHCFALKGGCEGCVARLHTLTSLCILNVKLGEASRLWPHYHGACKAAGCGGRESSGVGQPIYLSHVPRKCCIGAGLQGCLSTLIASTCTSSTRREALQPAQLT